MARRDRCGYPDCPKWARAAGEDRCTEHRGVPLPPGPEATAFERGLAAGRYDELFGRLKPLIVEAAEGVSVDNEIGVLRIVMARLLAEESDPFRLAQGVARITGAIVTAQKAKRAIDGQTADDITGAIATILEEMQP